MPMFYMHLRDGADVLLDPDGLDLAAEAVPAVALHQARDCMAGDVRNGLLDLRPQIDVYDATGSLVHSLGFADALKIVATA